ncbi:MAG: hypothetical protein MUP86_04240 [Dehalococcoidia bacterium]|nr:hypothetical protein [Dehalococcoidia bacterium]
MAVYLVTYAVGNTPRSDKVTAEEFNWISNNMVEFLEKGKVVARFANVSAVIDSENIPKPEISL